MILKFHFALKQLRLQDYFRSIWKNAKKKDLATLIKQFKLVSISIFLITTLVKIKVDSANSNY